jgi:hypothetical protein
MHCGTCEDMQPQGAEFCAACGTQLRSGRPLGRSAQLRAGALGTVGHATAGVEYWPTMLPSPGLRLRPEQPVRLTWRHLTRWVLGLFLTVVLLGLVFSAVRLAPKPCPMGIGMMLSSC